MSKVTRILSNRYRDSFDSSITSDPGMMRSEGERRVVTILFCDVVGSTAMANQFDPEDWADIMSEAFDHLIQPIERYEGTIFRLMGDAILAIFGAPQAHEDDPHRAILAGLEIIENVQQLSENLKREFGIGFNVRIGINTGLVVVGTYGSGTTVEYTAMGNAINIASKLEEQAAPGTILVGESTYRLSASLFDFEPLDLIDGEDMPEPEQSFRVLCRKSATSMYRSTSDRLMPFTDRSEEMAVLRAAIDDLCLHKRGRVIFLIGEPGVGKSRIVEELRRYTLEHVTGGLSVAWLENRISSYESSQPYGALEQRLRRVFDIQSGDSPEVTREKVYQRVTQFPPEMQHRVARVIERVFTTDLSALVTMDGSADFEPDEFKSELFIAMRALIRGWNPGGAVVLVSEDNHRADTASFELLASLFQVVTDYPIIFLSALRPERESPIWKKREEIAAAVGKDYIELTIKPLGESDARELVYAMIEDADENTPLPEMILTRAEGNPLFIEEILHFMADQEILERIGDDTACCRVVEGNEIMDSSIPSSLQALLLERIDRLPPRTRQLLQQAAVIGRIFSERVLREISDDDAIEEQLGVLADLDMLQKTDDPSGEEYMFRHALLREAAYNTVLHRQARDYHRRVGETMESLYHDQREEFAGQIGYHYYEAADPRAIAWLIIAAEQAEIVFEPTMVIYNTTLAIDLARKLNQPPETRAYELRIRAYNQLREEEAAERDLAILTEFSSSNAKPA